MELKRKIKNDIKKYYLKVRHKRTLLHLRPISEDFDEDKDNSSESNETDQKLSTLHEYEEFNQLPSNQSEIEQIQQKAKTDQESHHLSDDEEVIVFPT